MSDVPRLTVIRPVKGIEPNLYECLSATFRQDYPAERLTVFLCVSSRDDPSFSILERVIADFSSFDAHILVEDEDPKLCGDRAENLGPNPKIRNMSRAYREAKGDIVWIIDCNVWVGKGVCGRMVDKLCGYGPLGEAMPYKFVHHLPLVVDVEDKGLNDEAVCLLQENYEQDVPFSSRFDSANGSILATKGGRMEELFLSSAHAKFYTAINTVLVAPCIVGKSNMFRRSHLNHLTSTQSSLSEAEKQLGIDFFSCNICEDHLIGDMLWRLKTPPELPPTRTRFGKHALVFGDLAIQPMSHMSVPAYIARRVRWLRVRKFTVTLATLVEPGTESFLCSAYGAFAFTTLPWIHAHLSIPRTWLAFALVWLFSVSLWCMVDWTLFILLHSARTIELDAHTPSFARPPSKMKGITRRPFAQWLLAWLGRETLALPIWLWAVWGGVSVVWRDRRFWVGMDMRVHEYERGGKGKGGGGVSSSTNTGGSGVGNGNAGRKDRVD